MNVLKETEGQKHVAQEIMNEGEKRKPTRSIEKNEDMQRKVNRIGTGIRDTKRRDTTERKRSGEGESDKLLFEK